MSLFTDTYSPKEAEAMLIIQKALDISERPVVLSSFGKDSLVMLSLIKRCLGKYPDVVFWMDGLPMNKYSHALQEAERMKVNLFTYPPAAADYVQKDDYFDIIHYFQIGANEYIYLTTGCREPKEGEEFLCAIDLLNLPTGKIDFPWDFIFLGMKSCDDIHISDKHEIQNAAVGVGEKFILFPLHNWTDEDVWAYVKKFGLKVQKDRYAGNPSGRSGTPENDINNPDVAPTCYECLDYNNEEAFCPKLKEIIPFQGRGKAAAEEMNIRLRANLGGVYGK